MKEGSIGTSKCYLGANINRVQTNDGLEIWSMSSEEYVLAAIDNFEKVFK
jgi:hypothetical protein